MSNGVLATDEVRDDLLNAVPKGKDALNTFIDERLTTDPKVEFLEPVKKMKLKMFSHMKKTAKATVKNKTVLVFQKIIGSQQIKQWHYFLLSSKNKAALISFLAHDWTEIAAPYRRKSSVSGIRGEVLQDNGFTDVGELQSTQKEVDKNASAHSAWA